MKQGMKAYYGVTFFIGLGFFTMGLMDPLYDTYVPIFFAGHTVPAQKIERRVSPTDIAPTLSSYLGIKYPSGNIGDPLNEVFSGGMNSK